MTFGKNPVHTINPSLSSSLSKDQYGRIILTVKNSGVVRGKIFLSVKNLRPNIALRA